ncbi:MAG: response regulator [Rhizobium sp.]
MRQHPDTILIVEDDVFVAMDAAESVAKAGVHVIAAETVKDALEILQAGEISAAILDFHVRDGTVTRLIERLREEGIPYRIVSGSPTAEIAATGVPPALCSPKPADYLQVLTSLIGDRGGMSLRANA